MSIRNISTRRLKFKSRMQRAEAVSLGMASKDTSNSDFSAPGCTHSESCVKDEPIHDNAPSTPKQRSKSRSLQDSFEGLETDETRQLGTIQLQRLVLLEQLQVLRLKKDKLLRDKEILERKHMYVDNDDGYSKIKLGYKIL